jgi:hypothetical protein
VKFYIINIIPFILTFWYWFCIQYFLYNFNLHVFCINNFASNIYLKFLKNENNDIENKTKSRNKMKLLNNLTLTDIRGKIINTKDVKIKIIS